MADERRLREELEIQRLELEMQNDELRNAQNESQLNLRRYVELFDFAPIGYALLDPGHAVVDVNQTGANILGAPRSTLKGKVLAKLMLPADRVVLTQLIDKAAASGRVESGEASIAGKDSVRRVRLTVTNSAEGRITLLAFEDVTDQRSWEARVARTENALREANRRKDEFLAMLSHELRNPLAPMRSSLYALHRVELTSDHAGQALDILDRQVEHLARLVTDLLDVTRIARGKVRLQKTRLDLRELVRRTIFDYRREFESRGVALEAQLGDAPSWIDGDPTRVVQAISNLLSNAEKFTPPGGRVVVAVTKRDGQVAVSVRDNGIGIPSAVLGELFTPFLQGPQSMERSGGGLGLGLAMVKAMVELHGGSVTAASEGENRGAEVTIRLPLVTGPEEQPRASEVSAPSPRRRVLVIDDNADGASSIRLVLELAGHEVQVAHDGEQGLSVAFSFRPNVVVCDIGLPKMDGYAVARALRADSAGKDMVLIAVSGYARPEDVHRATQAGFDRHFAKPVDPADLDKAIRSAPAPLAPAAAQRRDKPNRAAVTPRVP